jgi:hypothetical protein
MPLGHALGGRHPQNPVTVPRRGGVQFEFPPGRRGLGPYGDDVSPTAGTVVADLATIAEQAEAFCAR